MDDIDSIDDIDEHIIVSNHKFVKYFENWAKNCKLNKPITIIDDGSISNETRLGAVKDIQFAIDTLDLDDDLLIVAGDSMIDFSFQAFVDFFHEKNATVIMCDYQEDINTLRRCGVMIVDNDFRVISMEEKPQNPKSNWCAGAFYIYKKDELQLIKHGIKDGCKTDTPGDLICYLCEKTDIYAFRIPGIYYDIGTFESYEKVKAIFKN